ncbi:DUF6624 domain-containing protein [Arhodomonas aquaeolei]|uniref:DUF6624 domain-containing protein n=1 Tax=Arhodomonas aquaeolei TaxID=2369 RepID=UPI00036DFD04|nr:DUF6624 domain-containing protein [Arhodomonas aquaeolei]
MAVNDALRHELLAMQAADQDLLQTLIETGELERHAYHPRMRAVHERNNARMRAILDTHGWPGGRLVGDDGARAAWLIVQHAVLDPGLMRRALPLLAAAVDDGDADGWCLAYLEDRLRTLADRPQRYGTQHDIDAGGRAYPLPIEDPAGVDERRRAVGLDPLAEATARIQRRYRPDGPSRE